MIQIRESDFLWKCYKRYYKYSVDTPHPHSICNFFWKAVGGAIKYCVCDLPILLCIFLFVAFEAGIIYAFVQNINSNGKIGGILFFIALFSSMFGIVIIGRKIHDYLSKTRAGEIIKATSAIFGLVFGCSIILSLFYSGGGSENILLSLWYGFLTLVAIVCVVLVCFGFWVLFLSGDTKTSGVFLAYISAVKNKVCPLVKAPWEEEKEGNNVKN